MDFYAVGSTVRSYMYLFMVRSARLRYSISLNLCIDVEYRELDEPDLCLLFTLLTFPVNATMQEIKEIDPVELLNYQSAEEMAKTLLQSCVVCMNESYTKT